VSSQVQDLGQALVHIRQVILQRNLGFGVPTSLIQALRGSHFVVGQSIGDKRILYREARNQFLPVPGVLCGAQ